MIHSYSCLQSSVTYPDSIICNFLKCKQTLLLYYTTHACTHTHHMTHTYYTPHTYYTHTHTPTRMLHYIHKFTEKKKPCNCYQNEGDNGAHHHAWTFLFLPLITCIFWETANIGCLSLYTNTLQTALAQTGHFR